MRCRTQRQDAFQAALLLLGAAIIFALTPSHAQAQHRGFSGGGHAMGHARAPSGTAHGGRGGAGFGGWTNRGGTWNFYTYNHGPARQGRTFRGRGHGGGYPPVVALPQPFYYLPFTDYGLGGFDMDDNGPDDANEAPPPEPGPAEGALEMNQAALANQLQQLHAEIENLKSEQPPAAPALPSAQPESASAPPQTPVTLVLRNGQELKVDDYAVMNNTFWDFSNRPLRKIPLSSIDIAASEQATEASGGDFPAISGTP